MSPPRKKLIEVALPLDAISYAAAREKYLRKGHPSTLHTWWSRKPLAAARAVLFAQLVDDPSAWPDLFPDEEAQRRERDRLFGVLRELVPWAAAQDDRIQDAGRREIARSISRAALADGTVFQDEWVEAVAEGRACPDHVRSCLLEIGPRVHDPFAGGGSIPLEAQRLGLKVVASDVNPVAALLTRALIDLPSRFAGRSPVGPPRSGPGDLTGAGNWPGPAGLAEDVLRYGTWLAHEAEQRLNALYPTVSLPTSLGGGEAKVMAWLWARTVASPDPAQGDARVPLISTYYLSKRKGREVWLEPVLDPDTIRFRVHTGPPPDPEATKAGTSLGRGTFRCLRSGATIKTSHIKTEGQAGRLGAQLLAVVVDGGKLGRLYLEADRIPLPTVDVPADVLDTELPERAIGFRVQPYGMTRHRDLYSPRQLQTLVTLMELVAEAGQHAAEAARAAGWYDGGERLCADGNSATAYGEAIATYLTIAVSRYSNALTTICTWNEGQESARFTFVRQALSMTWDYVELNPFGSGSGNFAATIEKWVSKALDSLPATHPGEVIQQAAQRVGEDDLPPRVFSFDPPFYDSIAYGDLSDVFYGWLRRGLRDVFPDLLRTVLTPKSEELIADPFRRGGRERAREYFVEGMTEALGAIRTCAAEGYPVTIYYAFKQSETRQGESTASTGWETFLEALTRAGFGITATWPIRTEMASRSRSLSSNALASSVVLACRPLELGAPTVARRDFRRALHKELPTAVRALQHGNIAPVDMAQAAIGPGMAIYARYARVVEADGSPLSVRSVLELINEILDEHLAASEGELDAVSRFAVTWYETHSFASGEFGDAENLARAKVLAVSSIVDAGIVEAKAGKVRLLARDELEPQWTPPQGKVDCVWKATQHLILRLESRGEESAAALLATLGTSADLAKTLAYRLYLACERKRWAEEARAYNALVQAWPELERLSTQTNPAVGPNGQAPLFGG